MILNETTSNNNAGSSSNNNNINNNSSDNCEESLKPTDATFQPDAVKSKEYWQNVDSTVDGMLGGFSRINHTDIQESRKLLSEYFNLYKKLSTPLEPVDPISSGHTYRLTAGSNSSNTTSDCSNTHAPLLCANEVSPSTASDNDPTETGENDTESANDDAATAGNTSDSVACPCNSVKRQRNKYHSVNSKEKSASSHMHLKSKARVEESGSEKGADALVDQKRKARHSLDAGAGIGRITKNLLLSFSESVDLLEQNEAFLIKSIEFIGLEERPRIGKLIASSLQSFTATTDYTYDIIWVQWVTGYLSDEELVAFFVKCASSLTPNNGLIFVKDNVTSRTDFIDADMNDSSVTRPKHLLESSFAAANLNILQVRKQVKFPRGLYPVYMWVLDKKTNNCSTSSECSSTRSSGSS